MFNKSSRRRHRFRIFYTPNYTLLESTLVHSQLTTRSLKRIAVPGIQAYVNRVLQKWSAVCTADKSTLTKGLTSHSFRRDAAQNANGNSTISTPWILDRGGWNLTSVSKAFNYIVSTTHEDQRVAKTLAGWDSEVNPHLPTLRAFDSVVVQKIQRLQGLLFASAFGFPVELNLRDDVIEVFMAVAILHYPDVRRLAPDAPYIKRVQQAISQLRVSEEEVAVWAVAIHTDLLKSNNGSPASSTPSRPAQTSCDDELLRKQSELMERQMLLINNLTTQVKALCDRVSCLEGPGVQHQPTCSGRATPSIKPSTTASSAPSSRRNAGAKPLSSLWYEWFGDLSPYENNNQRRYHEAKVMISFMRLFLPSGCDVTGSDDSAKARILKAGRKAEANILDFLRSGNEKAKSYGTVVKILKRMQPEGKLDDHIIRYQTSKESGAVLDNSLTKSIHELRTCKR